RKLIQKRIADNEENRFTYYNVFEMVAAQSGNYSLLFDFDFKFSYKVLRLFRYIWLKCAQDRVLRRNRWRPRPRLL
ncbi:hypothetical protein B4Q13_21375, partial [Lacticaseibacillus rhamnosus]